MTAAPSSGTGLPALLRDLMNLSMLLVIAAVLTAALVLQFGAGEQPCPLCLLERVGMFGVCVGPMLHFRHGPSPRHVGLGLLGALFLLVVSVRHVLLDIAPRPGHAYVGSAVLGLHMPVWSVLIAVAIIAGFAAELALPGGDGQSDGPPRRLTRLGGWAGLGVAALGAVNLAAVLAQCGFGACRVSGG